MTLVQDLIEATSLPPIPKGLDQDSVIDWKISIATQHLARVVSSVMWHLGYMPSHLAREIGVTEKAACDLALGRVTGDAGDVLKFFYFIDSNPNLQLGSDHEEITNRLRLLINEMM